MWLNRKVAVATPPPGAVIRPRLFEMLDRWPAYRVILLRAAAGYGKSSLLSTWVAARNTRGPWARVAWLTADQEDSDPVRFVRYFAAAIDRVCPGALESVLPILEDLQPDPLHAINRLVGYLESCNNQPQEPTLSSRPLIIIIDDFHRVQSAEVNRLLSYAIEHTPADVHFIVVSRTMPDLALARLYVSGQLLELTADDLRLNLDELEPFLSNLGVRGLSSTQRSQMLQHTEGWAAGLRLAAMSMAGHTTPADILERLRGTSHWQAEYLTGEVLNNQSPAIRQFLLKTSILDRLSDELCTVVTEDTDAPQLLAEANAAGLFLVAITPDSRWFRYHPIFQELLQLRLREQMGATVGDLHRRAGDWFRTNGEFDAAGNHYALAGDVEQLIAMMDEPIREALSHGELHQAQLWLQRIAPEIQERHPRLLLYQCRLHMLRDEPELIAAVARAAKAIRGAALTPAEREAVEAELAVYEAASSLRQHRRREWEQSLQKATRSLHLLDDFCRGTLEFVSFHFAAAIGQSEASLIHAQRAAAAFEQADYAAGVIAVRREMALYSLFSGRLQTACGGLESVLRAYPNPRPGLLRELQTVHLRVADALYWADDLDRADFHVNETRQMAVRLDDPVFQQVADTLAQLSRLARLDPADAADMQPAMLNPAAARPSYFMDLDIRLLLRLGLYDLALNHATLLGLDLSTDVATANPARLTAYLASQVASAANLEATGPMLHRAIDRFRGSDLRFFLARNLVTEAWRQVQLGDEVAATEALTEAVVLSSKTGIVRHILDWPQLGILLPTIQHPMAEQLMARMPAANPDTTAGIGLLTARERDILILLAQDYRYQDVASELVISIDTVRKHATSIYRKLGVNRRFAAVEIARQSGLVQGVRE